MEKRMELALATSNIPNPQVKLPTNWSVVQCEAHPWVYPHCCRDRKQGP